MKMMRTKRRETDLFLNSNISNSESFIEFPPPTMLKWHQCTKSWQNMTLTASLHRYFFGLHQALIAMFSSQGSKVAVFGWYQKSGGPVTEIELEFGVNQTDVSPNFCRSVQLTCSVPPRNLWPCTFAPQVEQPCSFSSFQCKQALGSSCSSLIPSSCR